MQLTTMQDIGGCRAMVGSLDEVRRVVRRWRNTTGRVVREFDYIGRPKVSGYRGVHLIVEYDGFQIEVQIRTLMQHYWATAVEKVGSSTDHDLKSGVGPPETLRMFKLLGDFLAAVEDRSIEGSELYEELVDAVEAVPDEFLRIMGLQVKEDHRLVLEFE